MAAFGPMEIKSGKRLRVAKDDTVNEIQYVTHAPICGFLRQSFTATPNASIYVPPAVALSSGSRVRLPVMLTRLILIKGHFLKSAALCAEALSLALGFDCLAGSSRVRVLDVLFLAATAAAT